MFVDSHCHLNMLDLAPYRTQESDNPLAGLSDCLAAARSAGVSGFLCVATDLVNCETVIALAAQYPDVLATVGVHPLQKSADAQAVTAEQLIDRIRAANREERLVVAVGETGLDYHYCPEKPSWQRARFEAHLQAAIALEMPLIIHSRAAKAETLALFDAYQIERVGGIMHCYTEDLDMAKRTIDLGFLISLSGIITFNNASALREVVAALPLDRLLIETDSPYLAPKPYRGRSNEPKYVVEVAKKIAEIKGVSLERVAEVTTANYHAFINSASTDSVISS